MKPNWKRRLFFSALALLGISLLVPVVVRLNFLHKQIAAALSSGLRHPVRTGTIRLKILGGIGFEIDNFIVDEDPRFGNEPLARMDELDANIAFISLWRRNLEFSKIIFVRPSLNA